MAYIVNEIRVVSRSSRYSNKLTRMLNNDIKKRTKVNNAKMLKKRILGAANRKQELTNEVIRTENVIKESEAAKAYFGLK